LTKGLPGDT